MLKLVTSGMVFDYPGFCWHS